jgi:D-mannonate dehydratase
MNSKKSIGIVNPHTTMFGYPLSWRLQGRPYVAKAKPILDIFQENFEVNLISDGSETSFGAIRRSGMTKIIANYEMTMWRRAEKLERLRVVSGYEKSDVNIVSWWNIGGAIDSWRIRKKMKIFLREIIKKFYI